MSSSSEAPDKPVTSGSALDVEAINRRIDDIVTFQKRKGPWYKDTGLMISAAAFFISIMTTVVSWYRTYQQDVNAMKTQLRSAIQQASGLAIQNAELSLKFKDDQQNFLSASSALNTQNIVLARQAYSLSKSLGASASAMELTAAANALIASSEMLLAEELLKEAVLRAKNSVEYVATLRLLSGVQFQNGQRGEAAVSFQKAIGAFVLFPTESNNQDYVNLTHAYSHLYWVNMIVSTDCPQAMQSVEKASQHLSRLPAIMPQANTMRAEVQRLGQYAQNCR
jgi:hypothetical protein